MTDWRLESSGVAGGRYYKLEKYVSPRTGITVCIGNIPGPVVNGYVCLRTEAHDDDGCPHTLEHLIFLGSEDYPYKGVLDSLANRCLARGTNAWTDVDHTCYTVSNAGQEAFLQILPVYMDHILYPTLTETGFHTEVHHVTGEGEDAGVVYCEMQGRENTGSSLATRKLLSTIYPGHCGYKSETGGVLSNLRSLHVDTVRAYHKGYYRPDNLCVIVTGQVEAQKVFEALKPVEAKILSKGALLPMERPWSAPVPPFTASVDIEIEFPAEDDTTGGMVYFAWRATKANNYFEKNALKIVWKYLTDAAVDPLRREFVDTAEPLASKITPSSFDNSEGVQVVKFANVPTSLLASVKQKFFEVIRKVVTDGVDMKRLHSVIHNSKVSMLATLEEAPHDAIAFIFIGDYLYGYDPKDFTAAIDTIQQCDELLTKPASYWADLLRKYLLDQPHVVVRARPSTAAAKQLAEGEKARVEAQVKALGEAKLKDLGVQLQQALLKNETPVPLSLISGFKIPDTSRIPMIPVTTVRYDQHPHRDDPTQAHLRAHLDAAAPFPVDCWLQFDHIPSAFVEINAFLDSSNLPNHLRPLLELFIDVLFELPIQRGGKLIPHEEVVAQLNDETISFESEVGFDGQRFAPGAFAQFVNIGLKVEQSKYQKGVQWMHELLYCSQFTVERLSIASKKILKDISRQKRAGDTMAAAAVRHVTFDYDRSNIAAVTPTRQQKVLGDFVQKLQKDPNAALAEMNQIRQHLSAPANVRVQVVCDLNTLPAAKLPWTQHHFIPSALATKGPHFPTALPVFSQHLYATTANSGRGEIVGIPAIESSYLVQNAAGPKRFDDKDVTALNVLTEYLTTMEGPFWKQIRGPGLSYGYTLRPAVEEGLILFGLSRSVSVSKAYHAAQSILNDFASGKAQFEDAYLDAARSSVLFAFISREETMSDAALQSFLGYVKGITNHQVIERVKHVTKEDVVNVLKKYVVPLFSAANSNVAITANPSKLEEIAREFADVRKLHVTPSVEKFFGLETAEHQHHYKHAHSHKHDHACAHDHEHDEDGEDSEGDDDEEDGDDDDDDEGDEEDEDDE